MKSARTKKWQIKRGAVTTKVYLFTRKDGRQVFTACWSPVPGQSKTRQFASYEAAYAEASLKAEQLAAGKLMLVKSDTRDLDELAAARKVVGDMPLMSALAEWLRARELTNNNVIPAAEAWAARNAAPVEHIKVAEVVKRFLKAKSDAGIKTAENHAHIFKDLTRDLGGYDLDTVSAQMLDKWLGRWEHPSTRNTFRKHIVALWRWSQKKGYLSDQVKTEAERTDRAVEAELVPGIINADTFERLLAFFRGKHPEYLPALVLAGFTGLRRSEIHDQLWSDINLAAGHLKVTKAKRGTPSRRLVPLCQAAAEWLMLAPDKTEFVCSNLALDRIRKIASEAKNENGMPVFTEVPENCFRHAFISHRVATTGDIARTSLEAGNSADMVRKHYLELVTKQEGEAWFAIRPKKPAKVTKIA